MKPFRSLIAAVALMAFSSCAGLKTSGTAGALDYVAPASTIAASSLLARAPSESDRAAKAGHLVAIASALEAIANENTSGAEIAALILRHTDAKPHWVALGAVIGQLYDQQVIRLGTTESSAILAHIAAGISAAAIPFVK